MAYTFEPEPDEKVLLDLDYRRRSKYEESLRLVVTNQAIFVPAVKFMISGDPHYLKRVPISDAKEVRIRALKPYGAYVFAVIMVVVGLIALWSFTSPDARLSPRGLGYALAIIAGGVLLPFAAKGRRRLVVRTNDSQYKWTAPTHVDKQSKNQMNEMLDKVVAACETVQIPTVDERIAA